MKTPCIFLAVGIGFFHASTCNAQTALKRGERPVFYSAQMLASNCETFLKLEFHDGRPIDANETVNVSMKEIAASASCNSYVRGWLDESLKSFDSAPYTPRLTDLPEPKVLMDTFIKYVKDHPEKENYAASTILNVCQGIIAKAEKQ